MFISYSHDSPEHKRWVAELAARLVANGVDVRFDQWDLRLGDDVPKFMERAVREADRVLMICTDIYVRKADDGVGGVGYEAMIVSGELIRDLGSAKFIPVVRQDSEKPTLPAAVSTRFYVNLSKEENFGAEFDRLLRELHQAPLVLKPALGKNPFVAIAARAELERAKPEASRITESQLQALSTPEEIYLAAQDIVLREDMPSWRSLVRLARSAAQPRLAAWWSEHGGTVPREREELVKQSLAGLSAFEPLIAAALAAVGTGRAKFNNQVALLEEIVMPAGWQYGGLVVRTELPHAGGFVYQAIHGALCLHTAQLTTAIRLVREEIKLPSWTEPLPIFQIQDFIGWPDALGRNSSENWKVLLSLPEQWPWLKNIFGSDEDFVRALVAYYMALNLNEYAASLAEEHGTSFDTPDKLQLYTPTHFAATNEETKRAAFRLLTADPCSACGIWRSYGVNDEQAKERWSAWLVACMYWHRQVYSFARNSFEHEARLIEYIALSCPR